MNPIGIYNFPGSLVSLAASKLSLLCWHQQLLTNYFKKKDKFSSTWFSLHKFSSSDILPVHGVIQNVLDYHIKQVGRDLDIFFAEYADFIPTKNGKDVAKVLENFSLDSNGGISYQCTARNLLTSGKLNSMQQYQLSCVFCFEEDIERLWPSVSEQVCIIDDPWAVRFTGDELAMLASSTATLNYWTYRMRNELHKVPGQKQTSAEFRVVASKEVYLWSEMEYFWNKLTLKQQISQIRYILSDRKFSKYLLPKLNKELLQFAMKSDLVPGAILCGLAEKEIDTPLVLQVWDYMKDSITGTQFFAALIKLIKLAFANNLEHMILTRHVAVLLFEIWCTAPEHLKNQILSRQVEEFFCQILRHDIEGGYDMRWYGRDLRFHLDLFSSIGLELRKKIWLTNWRKLIMIAKVSDLDAFLKLCFDDESEIFQFKEQNMMNYKLLSSHFDKFVEMGFCDELVEYLEFCSSNENRVRNMKKRIIDSSLLKMHTFTFDALVKFGDFIISSFPSPDLANQFKKKLIRECLDSWYELLDKSQLNGVKNIFQYFLSSKPNLLAAVKRKCYEKCTNHLKAGTFVDFRTQEWQEFLEWCAPSKEDLAAFKKSLPIDDIFNVLLTKVVKGQLATGFESQPWFGSFMEKIASKYCPNFNVVASVSPLKRFLKWYFESDEAVKAFKLTKIWNYKQVSAIQEMFKGKNEVIITRILNFLFHNDKEEMKKFTDQFF